MESSQKEIVESLKIEWKKLWQEQRGVTLSTLALFILFGQLVYHQALLHF